MKALFSFALVCALFSMSSFTVVKPPAHKAVVKPATVTWPITGTRLSYTFTITGSGVTPSYIQFSNGTSNYGPFTFTLQSNGAWLAGIPSTSPVFATIKAVEIGIYGDGSGYAITWHPDNN
jgi:hypothetical protein